MKNYTKIVVFFLLIVMVISCSDDDSNNTDNNFDITRYVIGGKIANDRLCLLTFEGNNIARLKDVNQDRAFVYSVENNTVFIEDIGSFTIENNELVNVDVSWDFSQAVLLTIPAQNAFLNSNYSGLIGNSFVTETFFVIFSGQEGVFGFGSSASQATPNKLFIMHNAISGFYQSSELSDVFFIHNGKLVYERKVSLPGLSPNYFYAPELDRLP